MMSTLDEREDALVDEVTQRIHARLAIVRESGLDVRAYLDDIAGIAERMTAVLPSPNPLDEVVGPFYDTTGLTKWLGISRQGLARKVSSGKVIGCQLDNDSWVYPTWQFTPTAAVPKQLSEMWRTLREEADPWMCATWLRTPNSDLYGATPSAAVMTGTDADLAVALARETAHRWSL